MSIENPNADDWQEAYNKLLLEQPHQDSLAAKNAEIERLRAILRGLLQDPEPTLDEPDTDGEVIMKQRRVIREALGLGFGEV